MKIGTSSLKLLAAPVDREGLLEISLDPVTLKIVNRKDDGVSYPDAHDSTGALKTNDIFAILLAIRELDIPALIKGAEWRWTDDYGDGGFYADLTKLTVKDDSGLQFDVEITGLIQLDYAS